MSWVRAGQASPWEHDGSRGVTGVNSLLTLSMSNASLAKKAGFKWDVYQWSETSPHTQPPFRPATELPTSSQGQILLWWSLWLIKIFSILYWINSSKKTMIRCFNISCKKEAWDLIMVISSWLLDGRATRFNFPHQFKTDECAHCASESDSFIHVTGLIGLILSHATRQKTL